MTTPIAQAVETTKRMSLLARAMPTIMRLRRSNKDHRTRKHVRRYLERTAKSPQSTDPPKRLRRGVELRESSEHGWRIFTISPSAGQSIGTVVYLHGGGWMNEAAVQHWQLIQQVALEASVSVVMPVYPVVQKGGTAASVVPVVAQIAGSAEGPVVMMGDSAGGTIAMSTSLLLRNHGMPPALTVLISPALDMRMENPEIDVIQPLDPWLVKQGQLMLTEMWIAEHGEDPVLNPIMGDPRGVGPLLIFSGTRDLLNPDTRLFVQKARESGANIEYHEQPGHIHVYPLLPTPESREARRIISRSVRDAVRHP